MTDPEVLTVKEAAALLKVCEETVRRKAYLGEIPGRKCGDWRFSRTALLQWLAGGSQGAVEVLRRRS